MCGLCILHFHFQIGSSLYSVGGQCIMGMGMVYDINFIIWVFSFVLVSFANIIIHVYINMHLPLIFAVVCKCIVYKKIVVKDHMCEKKGELHHTTSQYQLNSYLGLFTRTRVHYNYYLGLEVGVEK